MLAVYREPEPTELSGLVNTRIAGQSVVVVLSATIDGEARAWRVPISRDSTA